MSVTTESTKITAMWSHCIVRLPYAGRFQGRVLLAPRLLMTIPLALMTVMLAFSLSLWTSVWQARARDMRFVLMYSLGFWYLLTPIVYPVSHLPPAARWAAHINPMTGPVVGFKWAVLGIGEFPATPRQLRRRLGIDVLGHGETSVRLCRIDPFQALTA